MTHMRRRVCYAQTMTWVIMVVKLAIIEWVQLAHRAAKMHLQTTVCSTAPREKEKKTFTQLKYFVFIIFSVKIGIFYSIFYAALAALVALCMWVFFQTLDPRIPKWKLKESLIGTNPGSLQISSFFRIGILCTHANIVWMENALICRSWFSSNATTREHRKYINLV